MRLFPLKFANLLQPLPTHYSDHITELNNARPKNPFFFLKPPSSILLPGAGPVLQPRGVTMHHEVELGLVMGKTLRDLHPEDTHGAIDAIDSYILCIDMTARNVQDEAKKKSLPWTTAKGFDTFLPISGLVAKLQIPDPHDVDLWLSVDGKMRQSDSTGLMLFRIPRIMSDISRVMTLEPGDLVLTGTPKGVGQVSTGEVMRAGMRVGGKDIGQADMEVNVVDREGHYEFRGT